MAAFVDTTALYAVVDQADEFHARARAALPELAREGALATHNYVIVETVALLQARLGLEAVSVFLSDVRPLFAVEWVDEKLHTAVERSLAREDARRFSFVDRVSFELMRRLGLRRAFAFDADFRLAGFELVPAQV